MAQKAKGWYHKVKNYVIYDIKEIVLPSSLPDPPGYVPAPKKSWVEQWSVLSTVIRKYLDSWDSKKLQAELRRRRGESEVIEETGTSAELQDLMEEVKATARGGARAVEPYLKYLYKTRVAAYRDALKQFIAGYKEGFNEVHEGTGPSNGKNKSDGGSPTEEATHAPADERAKGSHRPPNT